MFYGNIIKLIYILVCFRFYFGGIKTINDAEVMIHEGYETVNLQGKGFKLLVKEKDKVKKLDY